MTPDNQWLRWGAAKLTSARPGGHPDRECYVCGSAANLEVHHVDWNHHNNARDNRLVLCHRCHLIIHQSGFLSYGQLSELRLTVQRRKAMLDGR